MVHRAVVQTVQACASMAACYLFASLYPDIRRVRDDKTTGKMPLLPLTSMFANCVLWSLYGFLARDYFPLLATNAVGIGFSSFYLAVYYRFTPQKLSMQRSVLGMCTALFIVSMYPVFSYEPRVVVQQHIGYMAITVCAVMFGSPLVLVKQVIATKNASLLPFGMIMASLINSLLWLTYGFILQDTIVILPNLLNLALGGLQLGIVCIYPRGAGYANVEPPKDVDEVKEMELKDTGSGGMA